MKFIHLIGIIAITILALLIPATAEVVYTPVNISIPVGSYYNLDINHDGVTEFILRSQTWQDECQFGDGYAWNLSITPATGDAVVASTGNYAAALTWATPIGSTQNFLPTTALLTKLLWGNCGNGLYGQWINLPNRFLGFQFRLNGSSEVHYGWASVSEVGYVDRLGQLHASTVVLGIAYETIPGQEILAGQTTDAPAEQMH